MTYVEVSREGWTTGKRKKTYYAWYRQYDISDDLWIELNKFAENDEYSDTPKWDWQEGEITLHRSKELDDVFKTYSKAPKDWEVFHDVVEMERSYIKMKPMKYKYEYFVEVLKVDAVNQRAYIKHYPTRKQLEEAFDYTTKEYWVDVSDKCMYDGIKPKDSVCVRKFLDDRYLAVYVNESYKEVTEDDIEDYEEIFGHYDDPEWVKEKKRKERVIKQRKSTMDLMGDY